MKKGFTLIELLAVIVIIALIAVITVPIISNIIDKTKKGALEDSAYGLIEAANLYYTQHISEQISSDLSFIPDQSKNGMYAGNEKLSYRGLIPETGSEVLLKTDGSIGIKLISGDYCVIKTTTQKAVTLLQNDCITTLDGNSISDSIVTADDITILQNQIDLLTNQLSDNTQNITDLNQKVNNLSTSIYSRISSTFQDITSSTTNVTLDKSGLLLYSFVSGNITYSQLYINDIFVGGFNTGQNSAYGNGGALSFIVSAGDKVRYVGAAPNALRLHPYLN
ncbi:MAG: prepilin-type N-terminal cleavage/methylation domain-containing protein [Bacilli bacterium]|nr:prepilin-type N-terminal cleavage/methylation domain-containing protein [Bacilli bacterium]